MDDLDRAARYLRDKRLGRTTPMTDDEWRAFKNRYPTQASLFRIEARRKIKDGSL